MISLDANSKVLLIDNGSVSQKLLDALSRRFQLLHAHSSKSGLECAKNSFEPDAIVIDLISDSDSISSEEPTLPEFWIVEQLRDIPVCFDIPIAVISNWQPEVVGEQQQKQIRDTGCRLFSTDAVEEILKYLGGGDITSPRQLKK